MIKSPPFLLSASLLVSLLAASPVAAHISLEEGSTHKSRDGDAIKAGPCGAAGSARGSNVYTYRPGATINIELVETIPHPGYFRIAFDADGDDDFTIPAGTDGVHGDCNGAPECGPGKEDYCSDPTVIWDNLNSHPPEGNFFTGGPTYTWSVTLPDVECDNCTLQIIQMMNDLDLHGTTYPENDLYYTCIDLVLSNDAPETNDTPVQNEGIQCDTFDAVATGGTPAGGGGEPGTTGGTTDPGTTGGEGTDATGGATTTTGATDPTTGGTGAETTTTGAGMDTTGAGTATSGTGAATTGATGAGVTGADPTTTGASSTGTTGATGGEAATTGAGLADGGAATGGTTGSGGMLTTGGVPPAMETSSGGGCSAAAGSESAGLSGLFAMLALWGLWRVRPRRA